MGDPFPLAGWMGDEYDGETNDEDRLAIGLLGEEVRPRWVCRACRGSPCLVYVENYRDNRGSTFALCETCLWDRLTVKRVRADG